MARSARNELVTFKRDGDELRGYLAIPARAKGASGLLLFPDVRGLYEHYCDLARRFAEEGFVTLALDPYSREGAPNLSDLEAVFAWMKLLPDQRILGDVGAALAYLGGRKEVNAESLAITGFCMGGQYALMAACQLDGLRACVSWYGMLRYTQTSEIKPESPLDMAPRLSCPYLGLFGMDDFIISGADVNELRTILEREDKTFEIKRYAGAGHAFFNDSRPDSYRSDAAADAWPRAINFLRAHLGG